MNWYVDVEQYKEAFQGINLFNGGIGGGFIARSQEAGGAGSLLSTSFKRDDQ
jgi:hypothetical protein